MSARPTVATPMRLNSRYANISIILQNDAHVSEIAVDNQCEDVVSVMSAPMVATTLVGDTLHFYRAVGARIKVGHKTKERI